jgi:hypothetical protein
LNKDWPHILHMLWSGEGLQELLSFLPGELPGLIALWLPRLFKAALRSW